MRPAFSQEEGKARRAFLDWARHRHFQCSIDGIGNLFIRRTGIHPHLAPILIGSHLDSQIPGGNFDGVYGVLAGFEALETLEDRGILTTHPVEVVIWTNEEGCRFPPTTMGSAVYVGSLPLDIALSRTDREGTSVRQAFDGTRGLLGELGNRELGAPASAYLEIHIEQGPLLEARDKKIGVVTDIQGIAQFEVRLDGEAGHAGTTPKSLRKDALRYALDLLERLSSRIETEDDRTRFTVGAFDVAPGVINTIPSRVRFSIDLRHPEKTILDDLSASIFSICERPGPCTVRVERLLNSAPVKFDAGVIGIIRASAERLTSPMDILSGATHDAGYMAGHCPSGMIFIPCHRGISHTEEERAEPEDMILGADVMLNSLLELDRYLDERSAVR